MMKEEDILLQNAREYYRNAANAFKNTDYNTAATLYFKCFASLLDYYIYLNKGIIPSSHSVRFRILEKDYPILYKKADIDFSFYQRSYRERLNKETCEVLKDDVEGLFKDLNIKI